VTLDGIRRWGQVKACGGDALIRCAGVSGGGGIQRGCDLRGEEPEMCVCGCVSEVDD